MCRFVCLWEDDMIWAGEGLFYTEFDNIVWRSQASSRQKFLFKYYYIERYKMTLNIVITH